MRYLSHLLFVSFLFFQACDQNKKDSNVPELAAELSTVADTVPVIKNPIGYVSDFDRVLPPPVIQALDSIILWHEKETSNEIVIVSLSIDSTKIKSLEDFSILSKKYMTTWGVGKKEKNNGVDIIFSTGARMIRIEVGLGLEMKLTNDEARLMVENIIVPYFKKGLFGEGILNGLHAIIKEIK